MNSNQSRRSPDVRHETPLRSTHSKHRCPTRRRKVCKGKQHAAKGGQKHAVKKIRSDRSAQRERKLPVASRRELGCRQRCCCNERRRNGPEGSHVDVKSNRRTRRGCIERGESGYAQARSFSAAIKIAVPKSTCFTIPHMDVCHREWKNSHTQTERRSRNHVTQPLGS